MTENENKETTAKPFDEAAGSVKFEAITRVRKQISDALLGQVMGLRDDVNEATEKNTLRPL